MKFKRWLLSWVCDLHLPPDYSLLTCFNYSKDELPKELACIDNLTEVYTTIQGAILVFGPKGIGKTELLESTREEMHGKGYSSFTLSVHELRAGLERSKWFGTNGAEFLANTFSNARKHRPALITIDNVDELREGDKVRSALLAELDQRGLKNTNVFVIATASNPAWNDKTLIGAFRTMHILWLPLANCRQKLIDVFLDMHDAVISQERKDQLVKETYRYSRFEIRRLIDNAVRWQSNDDGNGTSKDRVASSMIKLSNDSLNVSLKRGRKVSDEMCDKYVQWVKSHKVPLEHNDTNICPDIATDTDSLTWHTSNVSKTI
jgi:SpoVK/Ycf46/Vps4 family AAA+-type ATPase